MKTGTGVFLSSTLFGAVIALLYGFTTHDIVGVLLLGFMTVALFIVAIYLRVAERNARLRADEPNATPQGSAGEVMGTFALQSYWPLPAALAASLAMVALVFLPGLSAPVLIAAIVAGFLVLRLLVREST
jgi:hypothetical protein